MSVKISSPEKNGNSVGWSQLITFTVDVADGPDPFDENTDYVQFFLDSDEDDSLGIRAVDPEITKNKNQVAITDLGGGNGRASIEVYVVSGHSDQRVTFAAQAFVNGVRLPDFPSFARPVVIMEIPGSYYPNGLVIAAKSTIPPTPNDQFNNYVHATYQPIDTSKNFLLDDSGKFAEFVGVLRLARDGHTDETLEGLDGIQGLVAYGDKAGTESIVLDSDKVVVKTKDGVFDVYVCGGENVLTGDVHLDIEGSTGQTAGKIVVTDLTDWDPALPSPSLTGLASQGTIDAFNNEFEGYIPNAKGGGFSGGSTMYIVSWNDNDSSPVIKYISQKVYNPESWESNKYFSGLTANLSQPTEPGTLAEGIPNRIGYIAVPTNELPTLSSTTVLRVWKSAEPEDGGPPDSTSGYPAPTVNPSPGSPNTVTPDMCRYGLEVTVSWGDEHAADFTAGTSTVAVQLVMSGWNSNNGEPKGGTTTMVVPLGAGEILTKQAKLRFYPEDTAGYRDNPANGDLGTITVTWANGTADDFSDPTKTSKSLIDHFYSHEPG